MKFNMALKFNENCTVIKGLYIKSSFLIKSLVSLEFQYFKINQISEKKINDIKDIKNIYFP